MGGTVLTDEEILHYYENEAKDVPIFGSIREISLAENIMRVLPSSFSNVIDIGCGEGYLLCRINNLMNNRKYMNKEPQKEILFGLDLTEGRVKTTRKNLDSALLLRGEILHLPFQDNAFDVVICSELLEHIEDYKKAIDELIRITKNKLIITVPNELRLVQVMCPKCKTKHYVDGHITFFTQEKLKSLFNLRKDIKINNTYKFHTIYTYNRLTMKLPLFFRLFLEQMVLLCHKKISFLKPNFLLISLDKKQKKRFCPINTIKTL